MKFQFSGHESFICKHLWLKKGYDFITQKGSFSDEFAVVELGVGKNMVTSISYWLKAFGILDINNNPTELGHFIFHDKKGVDPYIENLATVWLLHYYLVKTNKASIYNIFFNEFRKSRPEFTKAQLLNFIKRKLSDENQKNVNENTLNTDVAVFLRTYQKPTNKDTKIDIEEDFSGLMIDLDLIETYNSQDIEGKSIDWYRVESKLRADLPFEIVLFSILDNESYGKSVSFKELLIGHNSPGSIFALNEEGLYNKIESIQKKFKGIIYTESAGIRELQFKTKPPKIDVLYGYYKN